MTPALDSTSATHADVRPPTPPFQPTSNLPGETPDLLPLTPDTCPLTPALDRTPSIEAEIIALFVDLMRCFGAPKSLGAIYGLLFVSEKPMSFEQIMTSLQLSSGSVSQGLRLLKELGAATVVFVPGDRRDHYTAETRLRELAAGFLRRRIDGEFINAGERLARVVDQFPTRPTETESPSTFLKARVATLERWQKQARGLLPVLLRVLEN